MATTSLTLLDRVRGPADPVAWDRFVRLYTPLLLRWAERDGLQSADAADLAQEVLVKLLRALPAYRREEGRTFRGWLRQVTANQARDYRRRRATRSLPEADGLSGVGSTADDPAAEAEDQRVLVRRALDLIRVDFSDATWAAFSGAVLGGRSAGEVAAELGVSVNTVYLARHRVLARLRDEIGEVGG
jgi:RNA polymerase sigma-70 factor (ECF subfamily)